MGPRAGSYDSVHDDYLSFYCIIILRDAWSIAVAHRLGEHRRPLGAVARGVNQKVPVRKTASKYIVSAALALFPVFYPISTCFEASDTFSL